MHTGIPGVDALIQAAVWGGVGMLVMAVGMRIALGRKRRRVL